jgi:hypothetical protein
MLVVLIIYGLVCLVAGFIINDWLRDIEDRREYEEQRRRRQDIEP